MKTTSKTYRMRVTDLENIKEIKQKLDPYEANNYTDTDIIRIALEYLATNLTINHQRRIPPR